MCRRSWEGEGPGAREIIELASTGEDDDSNLRVAQDRQLLSLLQQPIPPLGKRHLPARRIIDPPNHYLPSPHAGPTSDLTRCCSIHKIKLFD